MLICTYCTECLCCCFEQMQILWQGAELNGQKKSALFHFLVSLQHFGNVWKHLLINHHFGRATRYPFTASELQGIQNVHGGEHSRVRVERAVSVQKDDSVARFYEILCWGGSSSSAAEVIKETNSAGLEGNFGSSRRDENHLAARCCMLLSKCSHLLFNLLNVGGDSKFFCQLSINGRYPGFSHHLRREKKLMYVLGGKKYMRIDKKNGQGCSNWMKRIITWWLMWRLHWKTTQFIATLCSFSPLILHFQTFLGFNDL